MKSTKGNCAEKEKVEKNKPWRQDEGRDGWVQIGSGGGVLRSVRGRDFWELMKIKGGSYEIRWGEIGRAHV